MPLVRLLYPQRGNASRRPGPRLRPPRLPLVANLSTTIYGERSFARSCILSPQAFEGVLRIEGKTLHLGGAIVRRGEYQCLFLRK